MAFGANWTGEVLFGRFAFSGHTGCELRQLKGWCCSYSQRRVMGSWTWRCFHPCFLANYWHVWEEAEQYPCLPKQMKGDTKLRKLSWLPLGRWVLFQCCHLISLVNRSGMSGDTTNDLAWTKRHGGHFHGQLWHDSISLGLWHQHVSSTVLQTHVNGIMKLASLPSTKCRSLPEVCALPWSQWA